ncbi:hypothetical protein BOTBODRAFT_40628 [Botryobasidium botryosum FD-172 SS1]|uniref:Dienelactone hydrolase domain-containing protein n=1 Tax=Botryobasidium botryosum (strain FD-172 SS1) TaxID=930990 RepID=A0A067MXX3_BOTB1|nr:hypothetical protein BOTBODRAFT_40628 [Botryobasidium botryosum FD-172 SS1]
MSEACCALPAVVETGYEPKGSITAYDTFDKTYVIAPEGARSAIIIVYDIFGISPQIMQGADIVSKALNAKVVVPDFFRGNERDVNNYPPKTPEGQAERKAFFEDAADVQKRLPELISVARALRKEGFEKVGAIGYCWGGKLCIVAGSSPDTFEAISLVHPAFLTNEDGDKLAVPIAFYPTVDEPKDVCDHIRDAVSKKPFASKNTFHYFETVRHGFAGARANLSDPENKKQFEFFYQEVTNFFQRAFA